MTAAADPPTELLVAISVLGRNIAELRDELKMAHKTTAQIREERSKLVDDQIRLLGERDQARSQLEADEKRFLSLLGDSARETLAAREALALEQARYDGMVKQCDAAVQARNSLNLEVLKLKAENVRLEREARAEVATIRKERDGLKADYDRLNDEARNVAERMELASAQRDDALAELTALKVAVAEKRQRGEAASKARKLVDQARRRAKTPPKQPKKEPK